MQIKGDALLVVKQVLGIWQNKNPILKQFCFRIRSLLKRFEVWNLKHIDRSENVEAHEAAQQMITEVFVMKADAPMYLGREALSKECQFLLTGEVPREMESRKK